MSDPSNLSPNINLEFLRKEAKALLKLCHDGDAAAMSRIRAQLTRLADAAEIKLADVQHALAREHGYANWAALKRHDDPIERFLVAIRGGALPDAQRELTGFPEMAEESVHAACAIGDPEAAAHHLDLNPSLITAEHNGWPPLFYACASPMNRVSARQSAGILQCAGLLLDRGADPNTSVLTVPSDPESKLSAQYRATMSANMPVMMLLVKRGATVNLKERVAKMQTEQPQKYFQMQEVNQMMAERMEEMRQQPKDKLWGSDKWWFHTGRPELPSIVMNAMNAYRLLLQGGYDPNQTRLDGTPVFHDIARIGSAEMIELFLKHGADIDARC